VGDIDLNSNQIIEFLADIAKNTIIKLEISEI
jgi:hypothetical protein